jgi:hypothetical protein
MKPRKAYPLEVSWSEMPRPIGTVKQVTVRLLAAGAQIVPAEHTLDASRPEVNATFFVTPLVMSWIRAQRLEVIVQGRKVQEIPLETKVVCHRWSWLFLGLAILLPWLLTALRDGEPGSVKSAIQRNVPDLADAIRNVVPAGQTWWAAGREWIGDRCDDVQGFVRAHNVIFPTIVVCVLLALWSAFRHRDRRGKRWSNPIPVAATA